MEWFVREIARLYRTYGDELSPSLKEAFKLAILYFRLSSNLIGRMRSREAMRYLKRLERIGNEYTVSSAKRLFYEYLGHYPLAYRYLNRSIKMAPEESPVMWPDCRKAVMLVCGGRDPRRMGMDLEGCGNPEVPEMFKDTEEMTFLVQAHVKSYLTLAGLEDPEATIPMVLQRIKFGMERNYDHITLRILQSFVPVLVQHRRALAWSLTKAALSTARTERNRYMYEWFKIYDSALSGDPDRLVRRIEFYARRKYVSHEILARRVAYRMGISPDENRRISQEKAERYWNLCVVRMADNLFATVE